MSGVGVDAGGFRRVAVRVVVFLLVAVAVVALRAGSARADVCTVTWTGGGGDGMWGTASNWSTDAVPGGSDVACLPDGSTVTMNESSFTVGAIVGTGATLVVEGVGVSTPSLTLASTTIASQVGTVETGQSALTIDGTLEVSTALDVFYIGDPATISGAGTLTIDSGATATVSGSVSDYGTTIVNSGTIDVASFTLSLDDSAQIENDGVIDMSGPTAAIANSDHSSPELVNDGVVEDTDSSGGTAVIAVSIDNEGAVTSTGGTLKFDGGGLAGVTTSGTWSASGPDAAIGFGSGSFALAGSTDMSGSITIADEADVTVGDLQASAATVTVESFGFYAPTLSIESTTTTSHVRTLDIAGEATLSVAGEVDVASALNITDTSPSALSGDIVLESGSINAMTNSTASLDGGEITNDGTSTFTNATLDLNDGATFDNEQSILFDGYSVIGGSSGTPLLLNNGTVDETGGTSSTATIGVPIDNENTIEASSGELSFNGGGVAGVGANDSWIASGGGSIVFAAGSFALDRESDMSGPIKALYASSVDIQDVQGAGGSEANLAAIGGACCGYFSPSLTIGSGSTVSHVDSLEVSDANLSVPSTLDVASSFDLGADANAITGSGPIVTATGSSSSLAMSPSWEQTTVDSTTIVNRGTMTLASGYITGRDGATLVNLGTIDANTDTTDGISQALAVGSGQAPKLYNTGTIHKTSGSGITTVAWSYYNTGTIALSSQLVFTGADLAGTSAQYGAGNQDDPQRVQCNIDGPVDCATGNQYVTQTDLSAAGRGIPLELTRTYNSQAAATETSPGPFGYGWSASFMDHLEFAPADAIVTVVQADGSTASFGQQLDGTYLAGSGVQATLVHNGDGTWTYTLPSEEAFIFSAAGALQSETDRNGNTITLSYNGSGQLTTITDPASRTITLTYNTNGQVATATDPSSETVDYTYDTAGNLTEVTYPSTAAGSETLQFGYNSSHDLTSQTDENGNTTTTAYDSSNRVVSQTDPLGRTYTWTYLPDGETQILKPDGTIDDESFNNGEPTVVADGAVASPLGYSDLSPSQATATPSGSVQNAQPGPLAGDPVHSLGVRLDGSSYLKSAPGTISGTFTVEAWVKPENLSGEQVIIGPGAGGYGFYLQLYGGNDIWADVSDGSSWIATPTSTSFPYTAGDWIHLACVVTPTSTALYANGSEIASATYATTTPILTGPGNPLNLGGYADTPLFTGDLADVAVYNTALTATQIGSDYAATTQTAYTSLAQTAGRGLHAFYPLNDLRDPGPITSDPVHSRAQYYNGSNDTVERLPTISRTYTVEAWIKPEDATDYMVIGGSDQGYDTWLEMTAGDLIWCDVGNGSSWLAFPEASFDYTTGVWIHVACVVTPTSATVYVNGSEMATSSYSTSTPVLTSPAHNFLVASWGGSGLHFVGDEADVAVYTTALTSTQIADDYAATSQSGLDSLVHTSSRDLQFYEPFNESSVSALGYDAAGDLTSRADGNGNATTYTYDSAGDRTSQTDPNGHTTSWTYDTHHDITSTTLPGGETTTIGYNSNLDPTSVSRTLVVTGGPNQTQTTTDGYNSYGEVTSVTDPNSHATDYTYNTDGTLASATDADGNETTYTYDADGRLLTTVNPRGNVSGATPSDFTTTYTRDALGRVTAATDPLSHDTQIGYDQNGNVVSQETPNSHTTTTTYDADNEPTLVTYPDSTTQASTYNPMGQVTSQTDGNGNTTTYVYDPLDRLGETIDPLGRITSDSYDGAGNLVSETDAMGRTTSYTYDPGSQLTNIDYSDGTTPDVSYTFNSNGQVTAMDDGTGDSSYSYDSLGRLTSTTNGNGANVGYGYDLVNNETSITYPNSHTVSYAYDNANNMGSVTDWLSDTTRFSYDPDNNLAATTFAGTVSQTDNYTYNDADQLTANSTTASGSTVASLGDTYDPDGDLTQETSTGLGSSTQTYGYNSLDQLDSHNSNTYTYDPDGNPTELAGSTSLSYDTADELTSGPAGTYTYDSLGDRTQLSATGSTTDYGYDQAENLTGLTGGPSSLNLTYAYDGSGLLANRDDGTTTTHLTWDPNNPIPLLLVDGTTSIIYGPGDLPIEQIGSGGTPIYYHHDQLGSTRLLTDASGSAVETIGYSAYGTPTITSGSATTNVLYAGQYTDPNNGLIYMRARWYDPGTAQFLSVDPAVTQTGAAYNYAGDNPTDLVDPTGLVKVCDPTGIVNALFGGSGCVNIDPVAGAKGAANFAVGAVNAALGATNSGVSIPQPFCGPGLNTAYDLGGLFVLGATFLFPGEGELEAADILANPDLVSGLSPQQVDDLAQAAGYDVAPGRASAANPATRYYVPGTNQSEGFRVLPQGVAGQGGIKSGPYLRYFGGANAGVRVPLGGG